MSFHPSLAGRTGARWPDTVTVARAAGFGAVDLAMREIAGETADGVRRRLDESDLRPGGVPLPVEFRRDEQTFLDDLADLPELARLAAEVGVRAMYRSLPASGPYPRDELALVLRRRLAACASILEDEGLGLALEVLGPLHRRKQSTYEFIYRLPDCASFAETCGSAVGVLVDSWHWHHSGGTTQDIVALGVPILHVHIADAPDLPASAIRDDERLLPGDGIIDLPGFVAAVEATGYDGLVSPEIPGGWCDSTSPVACARRAREAGEQFER